MSWQDGSLGKGACHQAWSSECISKDPHGRRRKPTTYKAVLWPYTPYGALPIHKYRNAVRFFKYITRSPDLNTKAKILTVGTDPDYYSSHPSSRKHCFRQVKTIKAIKSHNCSKFIEQLIPGCSTPRHTFTAQLLYLRLREHHRRQDGKIVRGRGPGTLLWDRVS